MKLAFTNSARLEAKRAQTIVDMEKLFGQLYLTLSQTMVEEEQARKQSADKPQGVPACVAESALQERIIKSEKRRDERLQITNALVNDRFLQADLTPEFEGTPGLDLRGKTIDGLKNFSSLLLKENFREGMDFLTGFRSVRASPAISNFLSALWADGIRNIRQMKSEGLATPGLWHDGVVQDILLHGDFTLPEYKRAALDLTVEQTQAETSPPAIAVKPAL